MTIGPMKDKAARIEILASQAQSSGGIEGADVFEVDASKQSTKVNGLHERAVRKNTKRNVLYDTLIKGFYY